MNEALDIAKIRADIRMLMDETMRLHAEAVRLRRQARWDPLIAVVAFFGSVFVAHFLMS